MSLGTAGNPFSVMLAAGSPGTPNATASVQTTDSSPHTLIAAAGTGVRTNISGLVITNESPTATVVSLSDGTVTYKFALAANGGMVNTVPLPATSTNTAWTVTSSAVVTLDFVVSYVKA
jgi:hypothetical protein